MIDDLPNEIETAYQSLVTNKNDATAYSVLLLYMVRQFSDIKTKDEQYRTGVLRVLERFADILEKPTPPPNTVQPIIQVNIDTGAISQALLLGMKKLIEERTKTLSGVLSDAIGSVEKDDPPVKSNRVVVVESVSGDTGGTVGKSLDERIAEHFLKHPEMSVRKAAKALDCSPAKIQRWKEKNR